MSQKIIIHLSDLHVSFHNDEEGNQLSVLKSYLTTLSDQTEGQTFIDEFTNYIVNHYKDDEKYLIVSGDLADKAKKEEYTSLDYFLTRLITQLNISKDNILIVPGDHDVSRVNMAYAYEQTDKRKPAYSFEKDKFSNFSEFYQKFFGRKFSHASIITDKLVFDNEKLIIIGMNSNGRIGVNGGLGYMENDQLNEELNILLTHYPDYSKIALFHHNLSGLYVDKHDGQWDHTNKIQVQRIFENYKFEVVMYGNEHTSGSNIINQLVQISVGAFAKTDSSPGFKVYKLRGTTTELYLDHFRFSTVNDKALSTFKFGSWTIVDPNGQNENLTEIIIRKPAPKEITLETQDLLLEKQTVTVDGAEPILTEETGLETAVREVTNVQLKTQSPQLDLNENDYHKKLFKIVKDLNLFKSGHFHWSDSSKAHNWIDVPMLLSERDNVMLAQKAILDVVNKNDIKIDFVLGLGIEGNIIASYAALRLDKPYSYLPYSYRYNDHEEYEKDILVKNEGKYRNILIITDVVNNGKTVDRLVEREKEFFLPEFIDNISVVSLFYTGENPNNIVNEESRDSVSHYFVSHMKVERCPYDKDFRQTCMIYREKLACVHEFYDASI